MAVATSCFKLASCSSRHCRLPTLRLWSQPGRPTQHAASGAEHRCHRPLLRPGGAQSMGQLAAEQGSSFCCPAGFWHYLRVLVSMKIRCALFLCSSQYQYPPMTCATHPSQILLLQIEKLNANRKISGGVNKWLYQSISAESTHRVRKCIWALNHHLHSPMARWSSSRASPPKTVPCKAS